MTKLELTEKIKISRTCYGLRFRATRKRCEETMILCNNDYNEAAKIWGVTTKTFLQKLWGIR